MKIPSWLSKIDWWLIAFLAPLLIMSVLTMSTLGDGGTSFASKQVLWLIVSFGLMLTFASLDLHFLKQSKVVVLLYVLGLVLLGGLIFAGSTINGSTSWYSFGSFSFQPSDLMKLFLILILAKYLARRHVEIRSMKHLFVTTLYFLVPFLLIFAQPDFGSAMMLLAIWFGMILVSGISRKHILAFLGMALVVGVVLWFGVFKDYQKARIATFLNPLSDVRGTGYNAYQSVIAVGSGQLLGKGVGYGTQSRLDFLPEHQTDFIFASVSEEWGFVGSTIIVIFLFAVIIRILYLASHMQSNFELLFSVGVALYFLAHTLVNIGMNIGLLPVTGITLPFLSYGGSHLLIEFIALGIVMSFKGKGTRFAHSDSAEMFLR
jgi:rod shape determining protein RodA